MNKVVIISDTHFPFHHKESLKKVLKLIKKEKPTHVIQIGDLLDQYALSKYARSYDIETPKTELSRGREEAEAMWKGIQKIVPKAECIQLLGNHDVRGQKRLLEKLPEMESLVDIAGLYKFKKVRTLKSDRDFVEIDGVIYVHGWLSKSLDHAKHFNKPTVHGHRHRPALETQGGLWSMDVGYLGDESELPFSYTMSKLTNWTLAVGVVENGKPRLVLL